MWESIGTQGIPWECLTYHNPEGDERQWTEAVFDEIIAEDLQKMVKRTLLIIVSTGSRQNTTNVITHQGFIYNDVYLGGGYGRSTRNSSETWYSILLLPLNIYPLDQLQRQELLQLFFVTWFFLAFHSILYKGHWSWLMFLISSSYMTNLFLH